MNGHGPSPAAAPRRAGVGSGAPGAGPLGAPGDGAGGGAQLCGVVRRPRWMGQGPVCTWREGFRTMKA